ncbi:MAG: hypothetical protein SVR94_14225, partial [Pseudomonadota bacterium]|nr:hypothetical protein [Pseudomonadota bacterium]
LLMTNFYLVVLLTGAERLKIAYIMIIWAELLSGNKGRVMAGLSPLAHLQNFIMMPSLLLASFSDSIRQLLIYGKFKLHFVSSVIILTLFSAFLFAVLYEGVINKAMHYISRNASWYEMWKLALLAMLAILVTRNRWRMCLVLIPLFPAVYLLGGIRVNMIAITLVIYFLMQERVLNHPLVLLLLTYFSIKSVSFIRNIYLYGNGFV